MQVTASLIITEMFQKKEKEKKKAAASAFCYDALTTLRPHSRKAAILPHIISGWKHFPYFSACIFHSILLRLKRLIAFEPEFYRKKTIDFVPKHLITFVHSGAGVGNRYWFLGTDGKEPE